MAHEHHGMMGYAGIEGFRCSGINRAGRFGRTFPDLPPLYRDPDELRAIGDPGGPMKDPGPPNLAKAVPLGSIFFGQFIDHDITLDVTSSLSAVNRPEEVMNVRTPTLDLDCVYGDGPDGHPFMYSGPKLLTGAEMVPKLKVAGFAADDLPRSASDRAIIGDPRNDENRVISQMQLGFLRFHNKVVDHLAASIPPAQLFAEAQRVVRWHYQWVVVNDFLRQVCGGWIVDDVLANGRKVYRPELCGDHLPFIPIEFATAAYRFGHTMIAQRFSVQPGGLQHDLFGATLGAAFSPVSAADQVVGWAALLDGGGPFEKAGALDTFLAKDLLTLPFIPAGDVGSLATRNLLRGQSFRLPSGESIARAMQAAGAAEITDGRINDARQKAKSRFGIEKGIPFWLFLLAEGEAVGRHDANGTFKKGEGLGPTGARLVAEVIIGLLELDDRSYLGANRSWSPKQGPDLLKPGGVTTLFDLLTY